jgi:Zn-dependent M28 family amino/carboxypeptidase
MRIRRAGAILGWLGCCCLALSAAGPEFSGASALQFTARAVGFGPRPPGSAAIQKLQAYILAQLKAAGAQIEEDAFTANTPAGRLPMRNLIARFPGKSGRAIVLTGHYDTKSMPGIGFVGANDGGASTGLLLEMARVLAKTPRVDDVLLVFFDGEEAFGEWSATNGVYGSKHLAERWSREGRLARIKALINVDMIGDKDLGILDEGYSTEWLKQLIWTTARNNGYGRYFLTQGWHVEDDHVAFLNRGVPAANLIDFDYCPNNGCWHTGADTMDKLSAHSLEVVGRVLMAVIPKLEERR